MADQNTPQTSRKGLGRAGKVLLYISLAFNLAVVGLLIGAVTIGSERARDKRPPSAGEGGLRPVMQSLAPEDRRALLRQMRGELRNVGRNRNEMREIMDGFVAALSSVPYDPVQAESLLQSQLAEADIRLELAGRILLERVAGMSDDDRIAFAERLKEALERPRGPRGDKGDE